MQGLVGQDRRREIAGGVAKDAGLVRGGMPQAAGTQADGAEGNGAGAREAQELG